jgi:hypothetical protein
MAVVVAASMAVVAVAMVVADTGEASVRSLSE